MLTADNAYIADILILTSFQFSDKEQLVLINKIVENCTALRCYHLGGEQFAQFCATITLMVKMKRS